MKLFQKSLLCLCTSTLCLYSKSFAGQPAKITFHNDDSLRGSFTGITEKNKAVLNSEFSAEPIHFDVSQVSNIVFYNTNFKVPSKSISRISLLNNDIIEGHIIELADSSLKLKSPNLGDITIPKKYILEIDNKISDKEIIYQGPNKKKEDWKLLFSSPKIAGKYKEAKAPWILNDYNITHNSLEGAFLTKASYPDKFSATFNIKNTQPYAPAIILMADLNIPKEIKQPENKLKRMTGRIHHGKYLGNSFVMGLSANTPRLTYYGFNDDHSLALKSFENDIPRGFNRSSTTSTNYEIKVDKTKGIILLFVNNKISARWKVDFNSIKAKGSYLGFKKAQYSRSSNTTQVFISDITIKTWNGIIHPASPVSSTERDVILLKNDTDRISGEIISIVNDKVKIKSTSSKSNNLTIHVDQVKQIIFSSQDEKQNTTSLNENIVINTLGPDRYSAKSLQSKDKKLEITSEKFGNASIEMKNITSIKFPHSDNE